MLTYNSLLRQKLEEACKTKLENLRDSLETPEPILKHDVIRGQLMAYRDMIAENGLIAEAAKAAEQNNR